MAGLKAPDILTDEEMLGVDDYTKGLFASTETSGDITGDWLQLEKSTFDDLKNRKKIRADLEFEGLSDRKEEYDEVADSYLSDLKSTFGMPDDETAALWSYRPGWYKKYGGKVENIPDTARGSFGKTGKEVMQQRESALGQFKSSSQAPDIITDEEFNRPEPQTQAPDVLTEEEFNQPEEPGIKLPKDFRTEPFLELGTQEEFFKREAEIKEMFKEIPEGVKGLGAMVKISKKFIHRQAQKAGRRVELQGETPIMISKSEKEDALKGVKFIGNTVNELFWRPLTGWYQSMLKEVSHRLYNLEDYVSGKAGFQSLPRAMARGLLGIEETTGAEILEAGGIPKTEDLIIDHPVLAAAKEVWGATLDVLPLPVLQPIGAIDRLLKEGKYAAADKLAVEASEKIAKTRYAQLGNPIDDLPWEKLPEQTRNVAIKMTGESPIKQLNNKSIADIFYEHPFRSLKEVARRKLVSQAGQFRIGDPVKFGNKTGSIVGFKGEKVLLNVAGKELLVAAGKITPAKEVKAKPTPTKFKKGADTFDTESVESIVTDLKSVVEEYKQKIGKVNDNISVEEISFDKLIRIKPVPDARLESLEKLGETSFVTVIKEGGKYRPIDGQHRIALAEKQGKKSLKMIVANSERGMEIKEIKANLIEGAEPTETLFAEGQSESQKLLEFDNFIQGEGFTAVPTTPELRKFVKDLPANVQKREAVRRYEEAIKKVEKLGKKLEEPMKPGKVKTFIHQMTGRTKIKDIITIPEDLALREQLRAEARAAKEGFAVGKKEVREAMQQRIKAKEEVQKLISGINRASSGQMDAGYRDQIDGLLVQYDFKRRTARTMARREGMKEFIDRQKAAGEQILISDEQIAMLEKKTLNDISLEDLRAINTAVTYLSHLGKLKNKLIAGKEERIFTEEEGKVVQRIYKTGKKEPSLPSELKTPSMRKKSFIGKITNGIDAFAAHQRKTEFIARVLDGFKDGVVQGNIIEPIQEAYNKEALTQAKVLNELVDIMRPIQKDFNKITSVQHSTEGVSQKLTRQEMMAVYANSKSPINYEYGLQKGWEWTDAQIHNIINNKNFTVKDRTFVDRVMKVVDNLFEETSNVGEKLTGVRPNKRVGYWPKVTDKELSTLSALRQGQQDLFQDVVNATYVEKGFTKEIGKVGEPVSLDFFKVMLNHVNSVIHFQSHAIPVRDVQKIINSPRIKQGITDVLGENIYKQFNPWLKSVANPRNAAVDTFDKWAGWLKRNATANALGLKLSVSLKQFGSYAQTVHELGAISATRGFFEFYAHPKVNTEFVYGKSPQMKFREKTFDREVREWLETKKVKEFVAGKPGMSSMIYSLIKTVDKAATLPTWFSAYQKNYGQFKNLDRAIKFADGVVRRTQPAGSVKDLAAIMRGTNTKKLFTMFYTHFTNVYNQLANEALKLRLGEKAVPLRVVDILVAWWWLIIAPGVMGETVRTLGKSKGKDYIKGVASYGLNSVAVLGNFANSLFNTTFPYSPSAAFGLFTDTQKAVTRKKPRTKLKHATRASGYVTGLPMGQAWITLSGLYDLMSGQTTDLRRLGFSKYTLEGGEDKIPPGARKIGERRKLPTKRKLGKRRLLK